MAVGLLTVVKVVACCRHPNSVFAMSAFDPKRTLTGCFSDIRRDPPCLIFAEQLACTAPIRCASCA